MADTILLTKLFAPRPRPDIIHRAHLLARLEQGVALGRTLTLISAPAGCGKTTLVADWIARREQPAAWLSLESADGHLTPFLSYFVAAAQTVVPTFGAAVLETLEAPAPPDHSVLVTLLNALAALPHSLLLVLDDYHVITEPAVDDAIAFLIDHAPRQLHLVVTTREDPQLPLARYRARGQLNEVRAGDLRFSRMETAQFLNEAMGLAIADDDLDALAHRTEGWIAGLQLAALSLQGRTDSAGFIHAFAGSHRFIVDYLMEEVLQQQPESTRTFLLQTAILDRLTGPLCDAVTGRRDGHAMLRSLEQSNLFIVALDDARQWYRYHHLFADVLRARAATVRPDEIGALHRRAGAWHAAHGNATEAIRHALAAPDFEAAAALLEPLWPAMDAKFQLDTWFAWAAQLPQEILRQRPVLCVGCAWAVLNNGQLEAAEAWLQAAEQWPLDSAHPAANGMIIVDEAQFGALPASIASARAYIAQARGDVPGTIVNARRALDLLPANAYVRRGPAAALLGLAHWGQGELDAAHRALAESMTGFRQAGSLAFAISGTYGLADIRLAQGRLRDALATYEAALKLVDAAGYPGMRGVAELYLGLSQLSREMGDADAAVRHLRRAEELGPQAALGNWPYRWRIARAVFAQHDGTYADALRWLDAAADHYVPSPVPELQPIPALRARIWIAQGELTQAAGWAEAHHVTAVDDLTYLREFEHLTLARLLLAQGIVGAADALRQARQLLDRLLAAADAGGRAGSALEISLLQALAADAAGDSDGALTVLTRAVRLAEPQGYVQTFIDEGPQLRRLLYALLERDVAAAYVRRLLAAFPQPTAGTAASIPSADLIEPLTPRELELLHLIADGLTNQQIANRLFLSLHTVKVHARNIYGKLAVKNRTQAVAAGRALGLLDDA